MDFSAYKKPRQREYVMIALDAALRSLSGPVATIEIVEHVRRSLAAPASAKVSIGRILGEIAPHVPEAQRGEKFKAYGRIMQRWVWYPKGTFPTVLAGRGPVAEMTREEKWRAMPRTTPAEIQAYLDEMYAITGRRPLAEDEPEIWSA